MTPTISPAFMNPGLGLLPSRVLDSRPSQGSARVHQAWQGKGHHRDRAVQHQGQERRCAAHDSAGQQVAVEAERCVSANPPSGVVPLTGRPLDHASVKIDVSQDTA